MLSLLGFALVKQLKEEFGAGLIRGGYAAGSMTSEGIVEGGDIDMHIHFNYTGPEAGGRITAAVARLDELERILIEKLQEEGTNIRQIYDHNVSIPRSAPGIGAENIEALTKEFIRQWLEGETRDEVKRLLADLMGPAARPPGEAAPNPKTL